MLDGNFHIVKCRMRWQGKILKLLVPKWDSLCKHVIHKNANKNTKTNVK